MRRIRTRGNEVPVLLVAGVSAEPMIAATIALQWDLPSVVVVQHSIDPAREALVRTVSDVSGIVEREEIDLEHACTSCALREDVVPTLERLAASGRWEALIAQLPVTAEPMQVCRVIESYPAAAPHVRIGAVVVALDGESLTDDLVGDDLIVERGLPVREDDPRGIAETAAAFVEYADLVSLYGEASSEGRELVTALARPGVEVVDGLSSVDATSLLVGIHSHPESEDWVSPLCAAPASRPTENVWTLDFRSERPFHPHRFRDNIEALGRGRRRSRGCFFLSSRPGQICQWDGAGGMLSIGPFDQWAGDRPYTRIVVVGADEGRDALEAALNACLLTEAELADASWPSYGDGLEPWLGPIDDPAEPA